MAGIYSQGGSAGHRYAGWLSEVEAKNFTFGGKVFNGSPSAIYVGSNLVWVASPYSVEATEVLKATFPTQWAIIKDYGLAHPEIVPYVNQYPVGWGNIIVGYHLVEFVRSNTTAQTACSYIDSLLVDDTNEYVIESAFEYGTGGTFPSIIGAGYRSFRITPNPAYGAVGATQYSHQWCGNNDLTKVVAGESYQVRVECAPRLLSVQVDDREAATATVNAGVSNKEIYLLADPETSSGQDVSYAHPVYYWKIWKNGQQVAEMYPCRRLTDNEPGVYDVVRNVFLPNAGQGSLIIGNDVDTPWTPSTP